MEQRIGTRLKDRPEFYNKTKPVTFLKNDKFGFSKPLVPNSSLDPKYDFKFSTEIDLFEQYATL